MRILFFLLILVMTLGGCGSDPGRLNKQQILSLVESRHEDLQKCVDENEPEKAVEIAGIESVSRDASGEYIEFYCGGAGLVSESSYYGFYYSPDDVPVGIFVPDPDGLKEKGSGFEYLEPGGDNRFYTERIMENWYYYEMHY